MLTQTTKKLTKQRICKLAEQDKIRINKLNFELESNSSLCLKVKKFSL